MPLQDEKLPPLSELIGGFAEYFEPIVSDNQLMFVESLDVSLPVELDLEQNQHNKKMQVLGSTPTQFTETTIMPVFHQLRLHIEVDQDNG